MRSIPRRGLAVLALLGAVACGPGAAEAPPPVAAGAPAAEPAAPPAESAEPEASGSGAQADQVVARALDLVSRLRELPAKGPVKGKTIDRAAMIEHVKRQIRTEVPADVVLAQAQMLFALGAVDEKFDYEGSLLTLMTSQLAGFYEPKDKTMYLAADLGDVERGATLAHELVHALQDQHYDLGRHVKYRDDATDEQSAIHALAEGDATSAMLDQVLAARGMRAVDVADDLISVEARGAIEMAADTEAVPSIIKRSVVSPYVDGVIFVHWVRRRSGWKGVDEIWRRPPQSTEQILHPEKLLAREAPEKVPVPSAAPGGPKPELYHDVMGEQSIRLLFEEWMPRRSAITGASDWGGDRIAVFRDGDRYAVAWRVRYDSVAAARRGAAAFARGALRSEDARPNDGVVPAPAAEKAMRGGQLCRERAQRGPFAVVVAGRDVAVVAGPFRRARDGARSAGGCAAALRWAKSIAAQP